MSEWIDGALDWIKRHKVRTAMVMVGVLAIALLVIWALWPSSSPYWTGFKQPGNLTGEVYISITLWEWLQLLLLPLSLLLSAWWLGRKSEARDKVVDTTGADSIFEHKRIESNHQESRIQAYFDRMIELLLEHNLRESAPHDEVRQIAKTQTMTILWGLNGERKGDLTRFLYESQLIYYPEPIVSLAGADLSSAELSGINLSKADLRQARLTRANLSEARLNNADFSGADLTEADLSGALSASSAASQGQWIPPNLSQADLRQAILRDANLAETDLTEASMQGTNLQNADLRGAILRGADLQNASLNGANLQGTNLIKANLCGADLQSADLKGAKLIGALLLQANLSRSNALQANLRKADLEQADLSDADFAQAFLYRSNLRQTNLTGTNFRGTNLSDADLTDAKMSGADFRGAYLSGAKITTEQLQQAWSIEGATMPDNQRTHIRLGAADRPG